MRRREDEGADRWAPGCGPHPAEWVLPGGSVCSGSSPPDFLAPGFSHGVQPGSPGMVSPYAWVPPRGRRPQWFKPPRLLSRAIPKQGYRYDGYDVMTHAPGAWVEKRKTLTGRGDLAAPLGGSLLPLDVCSGSSRVTSVVGWCRRGCNAQRPVAQPATEGGNLWPAAPDRPHPKPCGDFFHRARLKRAGGREAFPKSPPRVRSRKAPSGQRA